jgi:hypothetical protein
MADVKITQLPAALSINDTDNLILDDGSSTYRVAADQLKEYMISDIPAEIDAAVAAANKNLAPTYNASSKYAVGDLVTYSGKLYKCIVPVTTPEAFDINKWDDMTASEVFSYGRGRLIASYNAESPTPYKTVLDNLGANQTFDPSKNYSLYHTTDAVEKYNLLRCRNNLLQFSFVQITSSFAANYEYSITPTGESSAFNVVYQNDNWNLAEISNINTRGLYELFEE